MASEHDQEGPFKGKGIGVDETAIAFRPKNWEEIWNFSQLIAKTNFVPKPFENNPGAILAAIQTGHELGLPPMASLQSIAVINGRPVVWGEGALALLRASPMFEWIREIAPDQTEEKGYGECTIKLRGEPELTRRFTKQMAEKAKLIAKEGPWQTYRGRMYQMRARAWAIRDAAPGVLRGVGIREEVEDIETTASKVDEEPLKKPEAVRQAQADPGMEGAAATPTAKDGTEEGDGRPKTRRRSAVSGQPVPGPQSPVAPQDPKAEALKWIAEVSDAEFLEATKWLSATIKDKSQDDQLEICRAWTERKRKITSELQEAGKE